MAWSTRVQALAALRDQMQDNPAARYTDAELGLAFDQAVTELSKARPLLVTLAAQVVPSNRSIRLDNQMGAATFGSVVFVRDVTVAGSEAIITGWQVYEVSGQQNLLLPALLPVGNKIDVALRGGYGFALSVTVGGSPVTIDTNIPAEWRELLIDGGEAFALELYAKREVGRTNVPPAVAQQNARAAAVKLRDFRQAVAGLSYADPMRQVVTWGLTVADERQDAHRGFE